MKTTSTNNKNEAQPLPAIESRSRKANGIKSHRRVSKNGKHPRGSDSQLTAIAHSAQQHGLFKELQRNLPNRHSIALAAIHSNYGVPIEEQLAGAIGTWASFVRSQQRREHTRGCELSKEAVREYARALDPGQVEYVLQENRARRISKEGARLFLDIVDQAQGMEFSSGKKLLDGLCDLIKGNPAYLSERRMILEFVCSGECIGSHHIYDRAERPLPKDV